MTTYQKNATPLRDVAHEVSQLSIGRVEQILQETSVDTNLAQRIRALTQDICYDRYLCGMLGVDYNTLPKDDVNRVKVFAYELLKANQCLFKP
jgi:hypothetical protein